MPLEPTAARGELQAEMWGKSERKGEAAGLGKMIGLSRLFVCLVSLIILACLKHRHVTVTKAIAARRNAAMFAYSGETVRTVTAMTTMPKTLSVIV